MTDNNIMSDNYTKEVLERTYNCHKQYVLEMLSIKNEFKIGIRACNFPEHISENMIRFIIQKIDPINKCSKIQGGDLQLCGKKIECKTITSDGPISFGPTESWDYLCILDAREWLNDKFILYRINLRNNSKLWLDIKISKKETYGDQIKSNRRPRIGFIQLKNQLDIIANSNIINVVYKGSFKDIFSKVNDIDSEVTSESSKDDNIDSLVEGYNKLTIRDAINSTTGTDTALPASL